MPTSQRSSTPTTFSSPPRRRCRWRYGHLIEAILATHHDLTGTLFDLPHVVDEVAPSSRLEVVAGDFFTDPLPSCDAYLLMNVVHDWDDQKASGILTAVAKSGEPGAAVLVIETVMPEGPEPHLAKTLDVLMLAVPRSAEPHHPVLARRRRPASVIRRPTRLAGWD